MMPNSTFHEGNIPFQYIIDPAWLLHNASGASILIGVALAISAWLALSTLWQYQRLRHFDGPFLAKVSNLWLARTVGGGESHLDFWKVTQKYGTIARIGLNDLVTDDPYLLKHMHGAKTLYRRSDWYIGMRFDPSADNCVSMRDENEHLKLRSKMAAGVRILVPWLKSRFRSWELRQENYFQYSGREVDNLELTIDNNVLRLANLLENYAIQGKPVDFGRKAQFFTLDVISDIAFGEAFGFLETDIDVFKYIETTEQNFHKIMYVTVWPWLLTLLSSPFLKRLLPAAGDALGFGKVMGIAKKRAAERFGSNKKVQRDMLGSFVRHGLTQKEAESEILLQIAAGSDTTASAVRSTMLHVMTNPRVMNRLLEEISTSNISKPVITNNEAKNMPYLQAVIKEGLRIFPPIACLMSKEVPAEGDTWNGMYLPGGTRLGYSIWAIVRREDIWGHDPGEFRPERWLEKSPDELRAMEGILEMVFGYGRWQCLGRPVALMELNKVFVELLRRFDWSLCDPTKPWEIYNSGIFAQSQFWVRLNKRLE